MFPASACTRARGRLIRVRRGNKNVYRGTVKCFTARSVIRGDALYCFTDRGGQETKEFQLSCVMDRNFLINRLECTYKQPAVNECERHRGYKLLPGACFSCSPGRLCRAVPSMLGHEAAGNHVRTQQARSSSQMGTKWRQRNLHIQHSSKRRKNRCQICLQVICRR